MNVANVEINPENVIDIFYDAKSDIIKIYWFQLSKGGKYESKGVKLEYSKEVGPSATGLKAFIKEVINEITRERNKKIEYYNYIVEIIPD